MLVGNDGGIWRSISSGNINTAYLFNQNLPGALLYSVGVSNDNSMLAGTQDNGPIYSDSGDIWKTILVGDSYRALIEPTNNGEYSYYSLYGIRLSQIYKIFADR